MREKLARISLQYKVILVTCAVAFVIAIPGMAVMIQMNYRLAQTDLEQIGITTARVVYTILRHHMLTGHGEETKESMTELVRNEAVVKTAILSDKGKVFASSEPSEIGQIQTSPSLSKVIESGQIVTVPGGETGKIFQVLLPAENQPECYQCHNPNLRILGVVEVDMDMQPAISLARQTALTMGYIAIATISLASAMLIFLLRLVVVKPVVALVDEQDKRERMYLANRLASIGELSSGIAHELNNPLTSIIGFSEIVAAKNLPDDVKKDMGIVISESQRMAIIIKNLLTFARKHPEEKVPVDINSILQSVLTMRAYEQKVNNINVVTHLAADLPKVVGNPFQLQQVFINLIINAEYFMVDAHKGGTLTITTKPAGEIVQVSFADDGPGISSKNLANLFEPFFTTKPIGKGTGLGLSICYGIVTEHGGRIYAESEPGKGATFVVELPLHQQSPDEEGRLAGTTPG